MKRFPCAHATHPQWAMAVGLTLAQLRAQMALPDYARAPALGLVYITDHYAAYATRILERLAAELPGVGDWAGATGTGVCSTDAEYLDEPAISVLLCDLPRDQYRVYSGVAPLPPATRFCPQMALVHADGDMSDLPDLIGELANRTERRYLFGGIATSRTGGAVQFAWPGLSQGGQKPRGDSDNGGPDAQGVGGVPGVFTGGLSGVAFARGVTLASRITQGCQPVAPEHRVTAAEDNVILTLDGQPALDVLLDDLMLDPNRPRQALSVLRQTLAGLASPGEDGVRRTGDFGSGVRVRHLIGIDPGRRAVIVADETPPGLRLAFCQCNAQAARADLVRICAEIREALEPQEVLASNSADTGDTASTGGARILGAHYVSSAGRGGPYFGSPGAELHIIRQALGDVPLTGFFAGGEIAHHNLHRYAGVLTVFAEDAGVTARAGQSKTT